MFLCDNQSVGILNGFNNLTLKQIFWKTKTFIKKLDCNFLVEKTNVMLCYVFKVDSIKIVFKKL